MRLLRVRITSFRSVKEPLTLNVDPKITVLIGANDHGKTNLLEAIRSLNKDRGLQESDESWDLFDESKLRVEYDFKLQSKEVETLQGLMNTEEEGEPAEEVVQVNDGVPESKNGSTRKSERPKFQPPSEVTFRRDGPEGIIELVSNEEIAANEGAVKSLFIARPRVELFSSATQYMDAVTLPQLEEDDQEFMQGIFRYAGIWDYRKSLFTQNPASAKRLEKASEEFTRKTRADWTQGEDLAFKFQHAGTNGDQIELLIRDPAVSNRFVRPSERSAGFSAFFLLNMRLLARTASNPAGSYVYLFDEPGTALHPSGQINLQRVFERLSETDQVVYATHSLFMINHNRPERNRVVSATEGHGSNPCPSLDSVERLRATDEWPTFAFFCKGGNSSFSTVGHSWRVCHASRPLPNVCMRKPLMHHSGVQWCHGNKPIIGKAGPEKHYPPFQARETDRDHCQAAGSER